MPDNMIRIVWNSGEMEAAAGVIAFAALAKLRKLIFPHLAGCTAEDKQLLISCITAEYRDAVRSRKTKNAENLYTRLSEFCTACGVDLPEDLPAVPTVLDKNFDVDLSKFPRVDTLAAPAATIGRCTVPIMHKVVSSCAIDRYECYAADGIGAMIDNIPCYAQKVKSNLYILNICGGAAPIYQWRTVAAAREGLEAAARECMVKVADRLPDALERFKAFCDLPDPVPADSTPTPAPEPEPQPEPAAPAPVPADKRPKKPKQPDWIGRKMVITIGERCARPAEA